MKESRELELKSTITNTFLKTVSAFSNYNSGRIIFGIDDNGKIIGLENIEELCLDLENKINDNIRPKPNFKIIKDTKKLYLLIRDSDKAEVMRAKYFEVLTGKRNKLKNQNKKY